MKLMILAALAIVATAAQANACDAGGLCVNKAAIFNDVKQFSQQSRCSTLTDQQALDVAGQVLMGQLSYPGFKTVYDKTCDYNATLNIARDSRVAIVFADIKDFSQQSRCATLTNDQASQVAQDIVHNRIAAVGFKTVYEKSCNIQTAYTASGRPGLAGLYIDLKDFSQQSRCATFTDDQALDIANAVLASQNTLEDLKSVYNTSCNLQTALEASRCLTPAQPQVRASYAPPLAPITIQPRHHRRISRR